MRSRWWRSAAAPAWPNSAMPLPWIPSFRRSAGACAWCRKSAWTKWRPCITAGKSVISAPASKPLDDARLEAKLRELAGPSADAWLRLAQSLEATDKVALP